MKKFKLRSGDKVWVSIFHRDRVEIQEAEVKGFTVYGIVYKDHPCSWPHYSTGLFYGFGYHSDAHAIVTKNRWQILPARICEKIRLSIPEAWCKKLGLE